MNAKELIRQYSAGERDFQRAKLAFSNLNEANLRGINLGEVSLYQGEFDDAQSYYNVTLRQYPDEPRANDAIDRLLLIKSSGGEGVYVPALGDFARALILRRQGDAERAVEVLKELGGREGADPIRVESLKALAEIYFDQGNPDDAVSTYKLIGDSLETPSSP